MLNRARRIFHIRTIKLIYDAPIFYSRLVDLYKRDDAKTRTSTPRKCTTSCAPLTAVHKYPNMAYLKVLRPHVRSQASFELFFIRYNLA